MRRGAPAGAAGDGGSTPAGGAAPAGERKDLLAELRPEEEPGPVLAQVLEQVLDLPLQPGDLALG